jgi:chromosome segregation ATPase
VQAEPFGNRQFAPQLPVKQESMSTELSEHLPAWKPVQNALAEVHAAHGEYQHFFSDVFDQLGEMLTDFAGRKDQWESQRQQTQGELERQAAQLEENRTAFAAKSKQRGKDAHPVTESTEHLKQLLEEAGRERAEMRDAQQAVHAQIARLADPAGDERLGQMLEEIRQQRAELQSAGEASRNQTEQLATLVAELTQANSTAGYERLEQMLEEIRQREAELCGAREASQTQAEQLTALAAELTELRFELTQKTGTAGDDQLAQMLEEIRQQRAELQSAREASQTQAEQLAALVSELTETRCELTEARDDIAQRWEKLEARQQEAAQSRPDDDHQEQFRELERQRGSLEQERQVLESELEAVRNRAAELAESLAEQKRQAAVQQAESADERKHMCRLLESISGRLAEGELSVGVLESGTCQPAAAATEEGRAVADGDAILDSVAAQFEILQKDLAKRRAAKAVGSTQ